MRPGRDALRLSRLSLEEAQTRKGLVKVTVLEKGKSKRKRISTGGKENGNKPGPSSAVEMQSQGSEMIENDDDEEKPQYKRSRKSEDSTAASGKGGKMGRLKEEEEDDEYEDEEDTNKDGWQVLHTSRAAMSDPIEIDSD